MKKEIYLLYLFLFCIQVSLSYYIQNNPIKIFAEDPYEINSILNKLSISYENVQNIDHDDSLYIISGNIEQFQSLQKPKYYIIHQTQTTLNISQPTKDWLSGAIAIWDCNLDNINNYKQSIQHYSYLPNEHYEFIDPVVLVCFLPINALESYRKILAYSNTHGSDISMHLPSLFCHCIMQQPKLIVEAGVRWGNGSTVPLYEAKKLTTSYFIGLDITDCSNVYEPLQGSLFLRMNDLQFASYLQDNLSSKKVDFVFIDTTHEHQHTLQEINMFAFLLSENGVIGFHDSNPVPGDPTGVKSALKEYFNLNFDESKYGNYIAKTNSQAWNIIHYPYCNGMTIAKKIK